MRDPARERQDGTRCPHCFTALAWQDGRAACVCGEVYYRDGGGEGEHRFAAILAVLLLVLLVLLLSAAR